VLAKRWLVEVGHTAKSSIASANIAKRGGAKT